MSRLVRRLSVGVAKSTTRRDFLSRMVRGFVGAGFATSMFFGGRQFAYANGCISYSAGTCGGTDCAGGDANGCYGLSGNCAQYTFVGNVQCTVSNHMLHCPANVCNEDIGNYWICCCNNSQMVCMDCHACYTSPSGTQVDCRCELANGYTCVD